MQTAELITKTLTYVDNIPDPTNGAHARRRGRYLVYAQEGLGELWLDPKELSFARTDGTTFVSPAATLALLPANFRKLGRNGTVWVPNAEEPMTSIPDRDLQQIQQSGFTTDAPEVYSIFGFDVDSRTRLIQVPRAGSAGYFLTLRSFLTTCPVLSDSDSDTSGLDYLAEDLVYRYLVPYLRWRGFDDRSDKRADKWEKRKDQALVALRVADQTAENTTQFVAGFVDEEDGGMW